MNPQEQKQALDKQIKENMAQIKNKIIVMSNKGGVGKSTTSVNLAYSLSRKGYNVGLLDADLHGPSTVKMLNLEKSQLSMENNMIVPVRAAENLSVISMSMVLEDKDAPVIWRGPLKITAIKQFLGEVKWGALDYLIIDSPPGTGDEPLTVMQLIPEMTGAVIVTTPQLVSLIDVKKGINFLKQLNIPIYGVLENMSYLICPHCGKSINVFGPSHSEEVAKEMEIDFLGKIPLEPKVSEQSDNGTPFITDIDTPSSKAFMEIVEKIINNAPKRNLSVNI